MRGNQGSADQYAPDIHLTRVCYNKLDSQNPEMKTMKWKCLSDDSQTISKCVLYKMFYTMIADRQRIAKFEVIFSHLSNKYNSAIN